MVLSAILVTAVMVPAGPVPARSPIALTVFAAASLKESFEAVGKEFERSNAGVKITFSFAGSQQLATQIMNGAPADIFASADLRNMEKLSGMLDAPTFFATNRLVIVTPTRSTVVKNLKGLSLAEHIVIAAEPVPAGKYTSIMLQTASKTYGAEWLKAVQSHVVSYEQDVRSVLAKVQLGEADAGVVYATDARANDQKVRTVGIPDAMNPIARYPASAVKGSENFVMAKQFVKFLVGKKAQAILRSRGFGAPSKPK